MSELITEFEEVEAEIRRIYEVARRLDPADLIRLACKAETKEERDFYIYIADMNLKREQRKVIEKNLF